MNKKIEEAGGLMKSIHLGQSGSRECRLRPLPRGDKTGRAAEVKAWMEIVEGM